MASRNSSAKQGASIDPALPQKKSARRRIIGAAAFFLAAAIILPIVLDSEPRQVRDDIQVRIPSRDLPLNEKLEGTTRQGVIVGAEGGSAPAVLDPAPASEASPPATSADSAPTPAAAAVASPTPPPKDPAETARPTSPGRAAAVAGAAGAVGAAAVAGAVLAERKDGPATDARPVAPKAAAEPSAPARPTPPPKPASKPALEAKPASEAKAAAAKPAPDAKPAPETKASAEPRAATGKIALQLGAFASEKGANEQMERARKAGFKPFTELVHTAQGDRIRVRVGPFPDREAADRARARLKAAGMASVIVNP